MPISSTAAPPVPTWTKPPPPPPSDRSPGSMSDEQLIAWAVDAQVTENAHRAQRLLALSEFHTRRVAENGERCGADPSFFLLTPLQATTAEFSAALSVTDDTVQHHVEITEKLRGWFPNMWSQCLAGRLDIGRAVIVLDAVEKFAHEQDIPKFAASMDDYFAKYDDPTSPLCPITRGQLQRAVRYRKMKFEQKSSEQSFAEAFERRRLSFTPGEDGMASLCVRGMLTDGMAADYHVTLIAKKLRENPEETRTLEQLRADVAIDLLLGRITVTASDAELEAEEGEEGYLGTDPNSYLRSHPIGTFARPVVNVTVPIQSLMGITNAPGMLSGGIPIPSDLARLISHDPDSTWYRMLTDEADFVQLSTKSYKPTKPIEREVFARDQKCLWHSCNRPAVLVELDHRQEYPHGETSTDNLGPLCKRHHKVKHSLGFKIVKNPDGSYTWTTRFGQNLTTPVPEQAVADWPEMITEMDEAADEVTDEEARGA